MSFERAYNLARRLLLPFATLGFLALMLQRSKGDPQDYSSVTAPIVVVGFLGGAVVSIAGPLFNEEMEFEPLGCLGWIFGFIAALGASRLVHSTADTLFLLIPVGAATLIHIGSFLRSRTLATSPLLPVLFALLALGAYVALYVRADVHRATLLTHILGIAAIASVLQVLLHLCLRRPPADAPTTSFPD